MSGAATRRRGAVIDVEAREIQDVGALPSLVRTPHPMTLDGQQVLDAEQAPLFPGETLEAFLARHEVLAGQHWTVMVSGARVPERMWGRARPKPGQLIEARRVPGRQVLMVVATLALAYFTFGAGGMGAGGLFASGGAIGGGYIAASAVFLAGSLMINKLLAPKPPSMQQQKQDSPTYGIQGGRNTMRQFEPMALVLGEPYCVPDLGAQPYVFFQSEEQYLWQVFNIGVNCAAVDQIKIGETDIAVYEAVKLSRDGMLAENTGLPALAANVDTIAGGQLDSPEGAATEKKPGPWLMRTTSMDTVKIAADFECQLTATKDTGGYMAMYTVVEIELRPAGGTNAQWKKWFPELEEIVFGNTGTKPVRRTLAIDVPAGQYDVRVRKVLATPTDATLTSVVVLASVKSYQVDTGYYGGQARLGVEIKATGQLNGSLDTVNLHARARPMPVWADGKWATATNRDNGLSNPGAIMLLLARGIFADDGRPLFGLGLPDSQIDIESLKGFMAFCTRRNLKFDHYLQEKISAAELIETVAAAGLGSVSWHTGRLGVIWFADDQPIEGMLNMGTIKAKSFSVTYETMQTADELEYQYFDRARGNSWQSVRVQAPGVGTPMQTAMVRGTGVTDEVHAGVLARFSMAQNIYQRKTVSCEVDLEHMVFRRGTVLALSHDLTQWGYGGRLQGAAMVNGKVVLQLDDAVPASGPAGAGNRHVGLRLPGERAMRVFAVEAIGGNGRSLRLATAWPGNAALPGSSADNPAHDTVWIYDFKVTPGQKMRVADIQPIGNLEGARVSLVPEEPAFWNYVWNGDYKPPPNNSLLGQDLPSIKNLRVVGEQVRRGDGWVTYLNVSFDVAGAFALAQLWAGADGNPLERIGADIQGESVSFEAARGQNWEIEIRPFDSLGRVGRVGRATYFIEGNPPANVAGLVLVVQEDGVHARWAPPEGILGIGWSATVLRSGPAWEIARELFEGKATSYAMGWLIAGQTRVWARHRNTAGVWSEPATAAILIEPPQQPLIEQHRSFSVVQLKWQDCRGTQPMSHYTVLKGERMQEAAWVGKTPATTFTLNEAQPGRHRYWVIAVDVAGNEGAPAYVEVEVHPSIDETMDELKKGQEELVRIIEDPLEGLEATREAAAAAVARVREDNDNAIADLSRDVADLTENQLRDSLHQWEQGQRLGKQIAEGKREIITRMEEGLSAEATERLELQAGMTEVNREIDARIDEVNTASVDRDGALAERAGRIEARVEGVESETAAQAETLLRTRAQEREAEASQATLLQSTLTQYEDGRVIRRTNARALEELTTRVVEGQAAEAAARRELQAGLEEADRSTEARVTTVEHASVNRDESLAAQATKLESRVQGVESETAAQAEILLRTRAQDREAEASQATLLMSTLTQYEGERMLSRTTARAFEELGTRVTEGQSAEATARRDLKAELELADKALTAQLGSVERAAVDAHKALAERIGLLDASVVDGDTELAGRIGNVERASADRDQALTERIEQHQARLTEQGDKLLGQAESITLVENKVTRQGKEIEAQSRRVDEVKVEVGDQAASIQQSAEAVKALDDKVKATWRVNVTANGKIAGMVLESTNEKSRAAFLVDSFAIAQYDDGGKLIFPFMVGRVAGIATVGIDGRLVVDGSIEARHIKAKAIEAGHIDVNELSAITAKLGYITTAQIDVESDGKGGWGWIRSKDKARDDKWGWILARKADGSTLVDFNLVGCGLLMYHEVGQFARFRLWGPGFNLDESGLTINQANVIDTLSIRGNAVAVVLNGRGTEPFVEFVVPEKQNWECLNFCSWDEGQVWPMGYGDVRPTLWMSGRGNTTVRLQPYYAKNMWGGEEQQGWVLPPTTLVSVTKHGPGYHKISAGGYGQAVLFSHIRKR